MWDRICQDIALALSIVVCTTKPFLYATIVDAVFNHISGEGLSRRHPKDVASIIVGIKELTTGTLICATVGLRTYVSQPRFRQLTSSTRKSTAPRFLRGWLPPSILTDNSVIATTIMNCDGCNEPLVPSTGHGAGPMRGVKISERLSCSIYMPRRGLAGSGTTASSHDFALAWYYYCLVILFETHFHPTFVLTFIYFAQIIHYQCRLGRVKIVTIATMEGRRLVRTVV